jgi:DNA-binding transcriptional MerR regulator
MGDGYTDTTSKLARDSKLTAPTIRVYADKGLLDFVLASNGTRLFREGQAARVRAIYRERIARRGRRSA